MDIVFVPESALDDFCSWLNQPIQRQFQVLFARIPFPETRPQTEPNANAWINPSDNQLHAISNDFWFKGISNDFWFKGILGVYKVVRNDLLIALHLALDLIRDCLVLRMMLRDRAKGTNHHRIGDFGNQELQTLKIPSPEFSSAGILTSIGYSGEIFDQLAKELSKEHIEGQFLLQEAIQRARITLGLPVDG
jgi:hypothetical protein